MKSKCLRDQKPSSSSTAARYLLGTLAAAAALPMAASTARADDPAPPSKVNFLFNLEFSDKYLTPRGMIVQDKGVVYQPLLLALVNVYKSDSGINDVTLVGGFWNCFGTRSLPDNNSAVNGPSSTAWFEIDPIAGISVSFAKNFKLDVTYTAFNMQIFNIPFSQHLETKLSVNDTDWLGKFALHPYFSVWNELDNKAVANTDAHPTESYYFDIGVAPGYTFDDLGGLKVEAPCRVLLPDSKFYGTGAGSSSTLGLYELGLKGTVPLKFMPAGYGHWSFHTGVNYMHFEDKNLKATQGKSEAWQVFAGVTSFF